jgi:hypothetical protein
MLNKPKATSNEVPGSGTASMLFTKLLMNELPFGREMSFTIKISDCGEKVAKVSGGFAKLARILPVGQNPPKSGRSAHTSSEMRTPPAPF